MLTISEFNDLRRAPVSILLGILRCCRQLDVTLRCLGESLSAGRGLV